MNTSDHARVPVPAYVTISSNRPERLVEFWTALLALDVVFHEDAYTVIGGQATPPPVRLAFQRVSGDPAPAVHLDLHVADIDAAGAEVERLGGRLGDRHEEVGSVWRQAFDPDGNVFCLLLHQPQHQ